MSKRFTFHPSYFIGLHLRLLIFGGKIDWENINKIPAQVWAIFLVIFGFWFGGRAWADVRNEKNG
jgi:hypothetical protein